MYSLEHFVHSIQEYPEFNKINKLQATYYITTSISRPPTFILNSEFIFCKSRLKYIIKQNIRRKVSPSPTAVGGPMLRPGIFAPVQPRSMGLSRSCRNWPISLRILISFSSRSGSSGSFCLSTNSLPLMIGALSPGHIMFAFPIIKSSVKYYLPIIYHQIITLYS